MQAAQPRSDSLTAVILYGAGQSMSQRFAPLAQIFADNGVNVVAVDFIGHGKTGGEVSDNSLALRMQHAMAAIARWTDDKTPLIIAGSSMSGHTATRVAVALRPWVRSLWLMQPAVYAVQAEQVKFDSEFTKILHKHESWRSSLALKDALEFRG